MKKGFKKLGAVLLTVAMALAMNSTVFAATTLGDGSSTPNGLGEQGVFASKDTPAPQSKTLILEKEIKVYNVDEATIKAPTISYTYTISPATVAAGTQVTDSDKSGTIHDTGVTVTAPVKAGVGAPVIANSGVVAWAATENVSADTDGAKNVKDISIDFSSVVFTGAGVYRYEIDETLTTGYDYSTSGVTKTTAPTASALTRYIDVYVRPVTTGYNNGSTAAEWDIYGFTCFYNNVSITENNKTTAAVKTTGFVDGTTDGTTATAFLADQYYTYNLTISKTVVNDGYGAANQDFPFTVLFTNNTVSAGTIVTNGATAPTGTDFTHDSTVDLTTGNLKGIATLRHGQQIKYVGIPNGTSVEVYETNTATGITYKVDTNKDGATSSDASVISGTAPTAAVSQDSRAAYQSTKSVLTTSANADDDTSHVIAITNTLLTISPTGFVVRFAPYALVLMGGIFLIVLGIVLYKRTNKEEA